MKHKGCTLHNPKHGQGFPWCPNTPCSVYRRTRTWNPFSTSQTGYGKSVRRKKTNAWTTLPRSWTGSCKTRLNPPHFKTDVITPLMAMYRWTASIVNPRTTATSRKTNYRTYHLSLTIWVSKRRSGKRTRQASQSAVTTRRTQEFGHLVFQKEGWRRIWQGKGWRHLATLLLASVGLGRNTGLRIQVREW